MSRKKEDLESISKNKIKLFVCGPTVYNDAHIGHGRTYIFFDVIKRYLEHIGYSVFYLQNITDIDDKIIKKAETLNCSPSDIANIFEKRYYEDMASLNINSVNLYARTSDFINEIINQIERIIDKGFAYETDDGVYFEVSKFKDYGKLSNINTDELKNKREIAKTDKRSSQDFVLWKKRSKNEAIWDSPWGKGRPGWHIEDTAITEYYFGSQYDIHGGGLDLIFPHHEAEITQLESISNKPLVKYWLHTGFLNISGSKMSKSLNNFVTIRDLLKELSPISFRFYILSSHYRSHTEFSKSDISQIDKSLAKIRNYLENLCDKVKNLDIKYEKSSYGPLENFKKDFYSGMDDDFNTPKAIASIFTFINDSKRDVGKIAIFEIFNILKFFEEISNILGIDFYKKEDSNNSEDLLKLIDNIRKKLRKNRMYDLSDEIRDELNDLGIFASDDSL